MLLAQLSMCYPPLSRASTQFCFDSQSSWHRLTHQLPGHNEPSKSRDPVRDLIVAMRKGNFWAAPTCPRTQGWSSASDHSLVCCAAANATMAALHRLQTFLSRNCASVCPTPHPFASVQTWVRRSRASQRPFNESSLTSTLPFPEHQHSSVLTRSLRGTV